MGKPREFEITLKSELIKPGHFEVSEEVLLLNRQDELISFPAKFHVIEKSAADKLADTLELTKCPLDNVIDECSCDRCQTLKEYRGEK